MQSPTHCRRLDKSPLHNPEIGSDRRISYAAIQRATALFARLKDARRCRLHACLDGCPQWPAEGSRHAILCRGIAKNCNSPWCTIELC
ncbi:hypothetical protein RHECIAT_CH0004004 [Rhizobium etli CIAT 652]|uniref:Uncharacterized protein n=1 Tax=Rhizobium etli (strain CIAT 652) TaxID=491916 RepID=B3PP66_RHIE6|nr:hypothetical protein RHECIAT_CH0004004 [Rhizobium etli CIAT 652]KKZ88441.1 hypothetical protein RPHASCH2410_CH04610 [Rhizobium phaseoli Ch24-10]